MSNYIYGTDSKESDFLHDCYLFHSLNLLLYKITLMKWMKKLSKKMKRGCLLFLANYVICLVYSIIVMTLL